MPATILDAIQDIATPAMIQSATTTLGLSEATATSTLAASATSMLGGLIARSGDAKAMAQVASLVGSVTPDASMFSNMAGFLSGGLPTSPANVLGNKFLGLVFGDKAGSMISAVANATGVSAKASSGLTTLAAPMVLMALRNKLGAAPTGESLTSLLAADRNVITAAMPAPLRAVYGLTAGAATPVAPVAPAPVAAAPVAPVAPAPAPVVNPIPAAPAAVTAAVAPAVTAATAPAATPAAQTSSGYATAAVARPVTVAPPAGPAPSSVPRPVSSAEEMADGDTASRSSPLALVGLLLPLAILAGLIWYWAYGLEGGKSAVSAVKTVAAPVTQPVAAAIEAVKPPAAPAPAPAAAPAAPASTALVPVPGANGMVKYTLPGGAVIEVGKDGLESKMLSFVTNKDAAIDKGLWFDFDRLSFVTASSDLTPESKDQVAAAVAILKAYPAVSVKVGGYTDNQGDADANLKLSEARAQSVMAQMVAGGIAADRIEAKGYGDEHPIGNNGTPEGRAKNRRTSLSVRSK